MTIKTIQLKDDETIFHVEGISEDEVSKRIQEYFASINYKLESGTPENGVYGIGNDTLRLILGGFYKRNKFNIFISAQENDINVVFNKAMTGISGGAIGYANYQKEFKRITQELQKVLS